MLEELWMVPLGFGGGILGSMIGLGGGIVIVPVLTFLGLPPALAASGGLFGAFGNASASVLSYARQRRIEYTIGVRLGLLAVPGTVAGAFASGSVAPDIFKILFGAVLLVSGSYMLIKVRVRRRKTSPTASVTILAVGASFFAGLVSSFFGVGGGIIFVPLMVAAMGMAMKTAAPTSQLVLLFTSISGLAAHSLLGHPDFYHALLLASGGFAGGLLGAKISAEVKEMYLRILISAAVVLVATKLFLEAMEGLA